MNPLRLARSRQAKRAPLSEADIERIVAALDRPWRDTVEALYRHFSSVTYYDRRQAALARFVMDLIEHDHPGIRVAFMPTPPTGEVPL